MGEWYPDDAALLALSRDEATGVEYIETGRSPYYLEFRRMLHRLLRAFERANDLRVYQDGELSVGVRGGRAFVGDAAVVFAGVEGHAVAPGVTTWLWLDGDGELAWSELGLPGEPGGGVALAKVVAGAEAIEQVEDLRGQALLWQPSLLGLGVTAEVERINAALDGVDEAVTAAALSLLCAGPGAIADVLHAHQQFYYDQDDEAHLRLINESAAAGARLGLRFTLAGHLPLDTYLMVDEANGQLRQRYGLAGATEYALVGVLPVSWAHEGALTSDETARVMGVVPVDGRVSEVVLSAGGNIESSASGDGVSAVVKVNGVEVTATAPELTDADGPGFRSTGQGDGTAAVVKDDGTEQVSRGDVLTLDLVRDVSGSVSEEARDVVVLVVVRADEPG